MNDTLSPHIPDPAFAAHLEWQVQTALRRESRFGEPVASARPSSRTGSRPALRVARMAVMLLVAIAAGACGVLAAQEIRRERAAELLAVQYEVRFEIARLREEAAREGVQELTRANEAGLGSPQECYAAEERRVALAQEASVLGLDAIEAGYTGLEPDRRLSAALVNGRDLVTERLDQALAALRFRVSAATRRVQELEQLHEKSFVSEDEMAQARLRASEVAGEASVAATLKELRAAFLRGEQEAGRVDLLALREEAAARQAQSRLEHTAAVAAAERARKLAEAGVLSMTELRATEQASRIAEARSRLADLELETIRARMGDFR